MKLGERKMEESRLTRLFKIAIAVLALLILGMVGGMITAVGATDMPPVEKTLQLERYSTYSFYPDGYQVDDGEKTPFVGTYILTGEANEDIAFKSYGEPVTYNVVFHNLQAVASSWYGMLGVDHGVTLNITAYGDNSVYGHNHPGFSVGTNQEGQLPIVNITMTEGSRIRVGCQYYDTQICIARGITVNLINGSSSIDMSGQDWQINKEITFTNGSEYTHEMEYIYVSDDICSYECKACDIMGAIIERHGTDYICYDSEHPDYATKHMVMCYQCQHEFESSDHKKNYNMMESTHIELCSWCDYSGDATPHTLDDKGCTVCGMQFSFLYEVDGEKAYIFFPSTLGSIISPNGGKVTVLQDVERSSVVISILKDTVIDLAGKSVDGISFNVDASAKLSIVDTSEEKSGQWKFTRATASYVSGEMSLEGIEVNGASLMITDGSILSVKDVSSTTNFFVRVSKARADFDGLNIKGTFDLDIDAYWGDFELSINNIEISKFLLGTTYGQDISANMLLPQGYAYSDANGIIDGSGVELHNITAIVEHGEHNSDKHKASSSMHWFTCTCGYSDNPVKEPHTMDADGLCGACGEKIVATLVSGDTVVYHANLTDAFIDTNNYTESKITLLCDHHPEEYNEVELKNKVIFDLNGYKYSVNGRLRVRTSLTIVDSSEGKTGKMHASGDISYIIEFYDGSTVTIEDGEYYGLIYAALYGGNESATITINSGRFIGKEKFRLGTGTKITVNGGVFECAESVFSFIWSKNVDYEINGGVFINSTVFYTSEDYILTIENVLGKDGDCDLWFISSTGNLLTVEELTSYYEGEIFVFHKDKQVVATNEAHGLYCPSCQKYSEKIDHTEMHIPQDDGISHLTICAYCEWEIATAEHTGGEASCTDKAECEYCTAPYGSEPEGHKYDNACDSICNVCEETREVADHKYDHGCDAECNECGYSRTTVHSYGKDSKCVNCGAQKPSTGTDDKDEGEEDGVGALAIVFIALGAVAILGAAGFAVYKLKNSRKFTNI